MAQQTMRSSKSRSAVTLVELMVVLVVLAMVATMTTIRFASPLQKQRVASAAQQWQSIDFLARKLGRSSDVVIRIQQQNDMTRVSVEQDAVAIRNWAVLSPITMQIQDMAGQPLESVRFVRSQGSVDYRVVLREGAFQESLQFAGGTGKVQYGK